MNARQNRQAGCVDAVGILGDGYGGGADPAATILPFSPVTSTPSAIESCDRPSSQPRTRRRPRDGWARA